QLFSFSSLILFFPATQHPRSQPRPRRTAVLPLPPSAQDSRGRGFASDATSRRLRIVSSTRTKTKPRRRRKLKPCAGTCLFISSSSSFAPPYPCFLTFPRHSAPTTHFRPRRSHLLLRFKMQRLRERRPGRVERKQEKERKRMTEWEEERVGREREREQRRAEVGGRRSGRVCGWWGCWVVKVVWTEGGHGKPTSVWRLTVHASEMRMQEVEVGVFPVDGAGDNDPVVIGAACGGGGRDGIIRWRRGSGMVKRGAVNERLRVVVAAGGKERETYRCKR
ncbi:hypothetical protein R3P38DRAFT_467159, partial [Favolaschia claudopus]